MTLQLVQSKRVRDLREGDHILVGQEEGVPFPQFARVTADPLPRMHGTDDMLISVESPSLRVGEVTVELDPDELVLFLSSWLA